MTENSPRPVWVEGCRQALPTGVYATQVEVYFCGKWTLAHVWHKDEKGATVLPQGHAALVWINNHNILEVHPAKVVLTVINQMLAEDE